MLCVHKIYFIHGKVGSSNFYWPLKPSEKLGQVTGTCFRSACSSSLSSCVGRSVVTLRWPSPMEFFQSSAGSN